jgi:hypothetical protein
MTREEKCLLAIKKGYKYNKETGEVFGPKGNVIKSLYSKKEPYVVLDLTLKNKSYRLFAHQFAWYYVYNETVKIIDHINRIKSDNRICNLRSVTHQENMLNRENANGGSSCYYFNKNKNKFEIQLRIKSKSYYITRVNDEAEAKNLKELCFNNIQKFTDINSFKKLIGLK